MDEGELQALLDHGDAVAADRTRGTPAVSIGIVDGIRSPAMFASCCICDFEGIEGNLAAMKLRVEQACGP